MTANTTPIRVLFVCMGNICRSPTAEAMFRHLAEREAPELAVEADSAGTHGYHTGDPPDARSQEAAARRGLDLSGLRARQLTAEDFSRFDLVLVMDEQNRRAAQAIAPRSQRHRIRLLLEFAPELALVEVPDPYYGVRDDFERVLDLTRQASRGLLRALRERAIDGLAK